jgi:hypothetical protein
MSNYVYQEFPKVKYHPKKDPVTVKNAEEEKSLGKGWYNNPNQFPKPSQVVEKLKAAKPFWLEWQWLVVAVSSIISLILSIIALIRTFK